MVKNRVFYLLELYAHQSLKRKLFCTVTVAYLLPNNDIFFLSFSLQRLFWVKLHRPGRLHRVGGGRQEDFQADEE